MSFSLHLSDFSSEQIAFGYSPAHETLLALHAFIDCKHHPLHIPWVIEARKKINPTLKKEIEAFSFFYNRPIVTFWNSQGDFAPRSFEAELDFLSIKSGCFFANRVAETILDREGINLFHQQQLQEEFIKTLGSRYPVSKEIVNGLVMNPDSIRQRFLNMLGSFWNACMKKDWPMIEELFLKDIAFRGKKLITEGPLYLLASLSQEIDIYPDKNIAVIRRISKADIRFNESDLLFLTPTYFAWPHLFVNRHKPVGINYSLMEKRQEAARPMPPDKLLKFFQAMGDFTRMQIVKYLAHKPRSTRELAGLIGITEGAVSKHLKQLGEAGLITSKRESYYVFYQLLEQPFQDLSYSLSQYIRQ